MRAAPHPRQEERLARLRQFDILDTPRESDFDEIVELASQICETPISVVNLIDMDRQWFKAEVGLGVRQTPLETSLCSHAILEKDYMEIGDTLADARTSDNPLCLDRDGLRFYAGYLLKSPDGLPLGTLCVLDTRPRHLSDAQRNALRVLARQVMHQLNLRQALSRQEIMRKEIDHRVKNSLQTIGAYVRHHMRLVASPEEKQTLAAVSARIDAVASLHEQFYRSDLGSDLDLGEIGARLEELTAAICPPGISLTIRLPRAPISPGRASALSMVVGEFIANAIKHAFPSRAAGRIEISGIQMDDGQIEITCRDDGVGTAMPVARKASGQGLGLRIVEAGIGQLNATPVWRSDAGGTTLTFRFDAEKEKSPTFS